MLTITRATRRPNKLEFAYTQKANLHKRDVIAVTLCPCFSAKEPSLHASTFGYDAFVILVKGYDAFVILVKG